MRARYPNNCNAADRLRRPLIAGVMCLPMIDVSENTRHRIEAVFVKDDWDRVSDYLLKHCGDNLPLVESTYLELAKRIRFAVLKLSGGNFERLVEQTRDAEMDWRDVLVAAGFGEDTTAHLAWTPAP